jgi:hypothetical protein
LGIADKKSDYHEQKTLSEMLKGLNKLWQIPTLPHCCVVPSASKKRGHNFIGNSR